MTEKIKISVEFDADKKGLADLDKTIKNVTEGISDSFKKSTKESDGFFSKLTKNIVPTIDVFNVASKAVGLFTSFIKSSVGAAIEEEKALVKLSASLRLTGESTQENIDRFAQFADSIEKTTGLSAEAVLGQVSFAKSLGFSNVEAEKIIRTATDLSAVLGVSLDSAVEQLTKTFSGNAGRLAQQIPELKNLSRESLIAGGAVELLNKKFAGVGAESIKTFGGRLGQLKITIEDIGKAIGGLIIKNGALEAGFRLINKTLKSFLPPTSEVEKINREIKDLEKSLKSANTLFKLSGKTSSGEENRIKNLKEEISLRKQKLVDLKKEKETKDAIETSDSTNNRQRIVREKQLKELSDQRIKDLEALTKKYENFATDRIKQLQNERDAELKIVGNNANLRIKVEENYTNLIAQEQKKRTDDFNKQADEQAKKIKELSQLRASAFTQGKQNIFGNKEVKEQFKTDAQAELNFELGQAGGFAESLLSGAEGARKLLVEGGKAVANTIIPGLGEVAGPLLDAFSQGPEAVKGLVDGFINAVPELITAIVESIPVFIDALIAGIPRLIDSLIASLPTIINALARSMPFVGIKLALEMPKIAVSFVTSLIKEAPRIVTGIISGLGDGLKDLLKSINPFSSSSSGGGISGAIKKVGKVFGFAEGGQGFVKQVPQGFNADSFPARLTSGELVVDRSTAFKLKEFLRSNDEPKESGLSNSLLVGILNELKQGQKAVIQLQIGSRELANQIIELRRQGYAV